MRISHVRKQKLIPHFNYIKFASYARAHRIYWQAAYRPLCRSASLSVCRCLSANHSCALEVTLEWLVKCVSD